MTFFPKLSTVPATRRGVALLGALGLATILAAAPVPARAETAGPTVFAAASMKTALDDIDVLWTQKTGAKPVVSYAASSALAKQIEQGAPADVFISADIPWMDYVAQKNLIAAGTRTDLLGNALVLVAPADKPETVAIGPGVALAAKVGDGKIATGDVASVPVGKYAKAALEKLGVWADVRPKIAGSENVRAALALVARGEARYGIVYATDAKSEPKVVVVGTFPADSHPPIVYPVAVTAEAEHPQARAYLDFLKGPEAAKIFVREGFTVLKR